MSVTLNSDMATWADKRMALLHLPNVTWVAQIRSFAAPSPGKFFMLNNLRFMATRSKDIDGIVFGVSISRAFCAVVIEGPASTAVAVIAKSPTVLETLVSAMFPILGPAYVTQF